MAGPVKTPWSAPAPPAPQPGQPLPAGQTGGAASYSAPTPGAFSGPPSPAPVTSGWFGNVGDSSWMNPQPAAGQPPVWGAAASPTAPGAPVWNPETKTAESAAGAATVAGQNLGGYGSFVGPGSYPGAGAAPPPTPGTLEGPGALETAWDQHGGEFFEPGPAQTFFEDNQSAFTQPGQAEQYFNKVSGMNAPRVENRADQAFDTYQREMPGFIDAPDLGSYYDVAEERAQRSLSDAQAARGVFGSSVASGQAGDVSRGLRAEQANREADYNLARNADRRATLQGLSGAGRAGDITDLQNAGNEMDWRAMLGNLAGGADANALGRLGLGVSAAGGASGERRGGLAAGMSAAGMAQGAEEGRERGALSDISGLYQLLSGLGLGTYDNMLGTDMDLMDGTISGGIGGASNAYNMDERGKGKFVSELSAILEALSGGGVI